MGEREKGASERISNPDKAEVMAYAEKPYRDAVLDASQAAQRVIEENHQAIVSEIERNGGINLNTSDRQTVRYAIDKGIYEPPLMTLAEHIKRGPDSLSPAQLEQVYDQLAKDSTSRARYETDQSIIADHLADSPLSTGPTHDRFKLAVRSAHPSIQNDVTWRHPDGGMTSQLTPKEDEEGMRQIRKDRSRTMIGDFVSDEAGKAYDQIHPEDQAA